MNVLEMNCFGNRDNRTNDTDNQDIASFRLFNELVVSLTIPRPSDGLMPNVSVSVLSRTRTVVSLCIVTRFYSLHRTWDENSWKVWYFLKAEQLQLTRYDV